MIVLVTGGRDYSNEDYVRHVLSKYDKTGTYLVNGGARGLDFLARKVWHHEFMRPYVTHPAAWNRTGKAAGQARNITMVRGLSLAPYAELVPDVVVAFRGGRGTEHCIREAEKEGIRVEYAYSQE